MGPFGIFNVVVEILSDMANYYPVIEKQYDELAKEAIKSSLLGMHEAIKSLFQGDALRQFIDWRKHSPSGQLIDYKGKPEELSDKAYEQIAFVLSEFSKSSPTYPKALEIAKMVRESFITNFYQVSKSFGKKVSSKIHSWFNMASLGVAYFRKSGDIKLPDEIQFRVNKIELPSKTQLLIKAIEKVDTSKLAQKYYELTEDTLTSKAIWKAIKNYTKQECEYYIKLAKIDPECAEDGLFAEFVLDYQTEFKDYLLNWNNVDLSLEQLE